MIDERVKYVPIGCQQCVECRKQKARSWQVRLMEDLKTNSNAKFITLTFATEWLIELADTEKTYVDIETGQIYKKKINTFTGYDLDNEIVTVAIRYFLERWRKKYKKSLKHWLVTELGHGETEHVHLHGIIWTDEPLDEVEKIWQYGFMWKGKEKTNRKTGEKYYENYVNERTVNYIVKYISKVDEKHKAYKSIILTSPGIGANYTKTHDSKNNKFNDKKTNETYRTRQGYKLTLPIYYRNKLYTEQQREQLWIQKLDKCERWVLGNKIDITENQDEYYKALKWAQRQNTELGYGKPITWEEECYEQRRRQLIHKKRLLCTA